MDSARVPGADMEEVKERLFGLIRSVRSIDMYRNVPLLFIPENAPGPIGPTFVYLITQEQKNTDHGLGVICTMRESGKNRTHGVVKTKETTERMVRYVCQLLQYGQIVFSDQLMGGVRTTAMAMRDKLLKQMREFKYDIKWNKNDIMSEPKGKWQGPQDDLLVSLMTSIYWEAMFWDSQYQGYEQFKALVSSHNRKRKRTANF